jgi:hypothetical protein
MLRRCIKRKIFHVAEARRHVHKVSAGRGIKRLEIVRCAELIIIMDPASALEHTRKRTPTI